MDFYGKLRVRSGSKVNLNKISPDENFGWHDREKVKARIAENSRRLLELQYKLYAENRQSLLIVLQAMDAGGKDGVINNVLYAMNPQGCRSQSFKLPTPLESAHDFLWRVHNAAPHNGEVVIFNRSHYECVLVERIHGGVTGPKLRQRFDFINAFEDMLMSNNTTVLKFFLHISKDEQLRRFGERLRDPAKQWKISENDYKEREFWDDYMNAFNDAISHCSREAAPWFIIPANDKLFRNLAVSEIIVRTMTRMDPQTPAPTVNLDEIRRLYHHDEVELKKADPTAPPPPDAVEKADGHRRKDKKNHKKADRNSTDMGDAAPKAKKHKK